MGAISTDITLGRWITEEQCSSSEKVELSADQFVSAITTGRAIDKSGKEINFWVLEHFNYPDSYIVDNVIVHEPVRIERLSFSKIIVLKCSSLENLFIKECEFQKKVHFIKVNIEERFSIHDISIGEELSLSDMNVQNTFELYRSTINRLDFSRNCLCKEIGIYGGTYFNIRFPRIPKEGKLLLYKVAFVTLSFYEFSNLGYIHLNGLKPQENSSIWITDSIMGLWEIISCNFGKTAILIFSSKITDGFYTNTIFPKRLDVGFGRTKKEDHPHLRDSYNQLKTIASKQSDRKHFLQFQAAELRSFEATLSWFKDFPTKFQLNAMRLSNNYGDSWVRGILFILFFNLLFLLLAKHQETLQFLKNYSSQVAKSKFASFLANYFEFLFSIAKKPDWIETDFGTIVFYISRAFITFGIYQMVAAFRKFGKGD